MRGRATVVLDVGKTLSKLSLWDPDGRQIAYRSRANDRIDTGAYTALDAEGIEEFVAESLTSFARLADIGAIIPVSHGAGAAIIADRELVLPPLDYEHPIPAAIRRDYDTQRDPFTATGSPALPDGLNLGAQLYYLEATHPDLFDTEITILPWAQYWSWLLSGVAASEITSLGCHTDLWQPLARTPSELSVRRGWSRHIAPLQPAGAVLGRITPTWARRTGLWHHVEVHCGLHDSNAALLAARAFPEIAENESTVLSTGTWFVGMRTPAAGVSVDIASLDEKRDCLVNIDAFGNPIPSSRFMGGREIELLTGLDTRRIDIRPDQPVLVASVTNVLDTDAAVLPTLAPGCGPFPHGRGRWTSMPDDETHRRTAVCLYAALIADAALDLVGARERLLIEGRFSESEVFVRALAALRPNTHVYVSHARSDVSFGALRLVHPELQPPTSLVRVLPLAESLYSYRDRWRQEAERTERASA